MDYVLLYIRDSPENNISLYEDLKMLYCPFGNLQNYLNKDNHKYKYIKIYIKKINTASIIHYTVISLNNNI